MDSYEVIKYYRSLSTSIFRKIKLPMFPSMSGESMYCIIVGGGRLGTGLAYDLAAKGNDVVIVEKNPESANLLRANTSFFVVTGDGTEISTLESAGANKADALFTVTGDDNANLVAAQLGDYHFAIPNIVLGANNHSNVKIFKELGIRKVVDWTEDAVQKLLDAMNDMRSSAIIGDGVARVLEFEVEKESYADGTPIEKLYLPEESSLCAVIRNGKIIEAERNVVLRPGDAVVVFTAPEEVKRICKIFSKEIA